jgi:DnaJ-class molecular chaperone
MAGKDKPKPRTCPRCHGSGGWWEVSNGKGFGGGKRRWPCPACSQRGG